MASGIPVHAPHFRGIESEGKVPGTAARVMSRMRNATKTALFWLVTAAAGATGAVEAYRNTEITDTSSVHRIFEDAINETQFEEIQKSAILIMRNACTKEGEAALDAFIADWKPERKYTISAAASEYAGYLDSQSPNQRRPSPSEFPPIAQQRLRNFFLQEIREGMGIIPLSRLQNSSDVQTQSELAAKLFLNSDNDH